MQLNPHYKPRLSPMCRPLLRALRSLGGSASPRQAFEQIYQELNPSPEERSRRTDSGALQFENKIRWARKELVDVEFIDNSVHGTWTLTPLGRAVTRGLL